MVKRSQDFGLVTGIMAPIIQIQQHGFSLIREAGTVNFEYAQLHSRLDWIYKTGVDFISTVMGFSEFTHGNATRMLMYLNESTRYTSEKYQRKGFYVSVHISSNQMVDDFADPWTGKPPINYNFIAHHGDKRLGVFPHTVQIYALDDPSPTYGNHNFSHMLKFMFLQADKRETLWFPETAYWVNYDNNVPLFLPIYRTRLERQ